MIGNELTGAMNELVYVIVGKEESLVGMHCGQLLDRLLDPAERCTGLTIVEGATAAASDVLDELRTSPLLARRRVVCVKHADEFVSNCRQLLERYFDKPCNTGVLVLLVTTWPKQTKLAKKLPDVGALIEVTAPTARDLPLRLIAYAGQTHGKKLSKQTAELLIELAGDEFVSLCTEIDKLALFADASDAITSAHVQSLTGHNRIFGAFEVIDTVTAGHVGRAIERMRNMFAEDRSSEFRVVGAFAFHLRRMFTAKALIERGVPPDDICRQLRIWSNKGKFFSLLRRLALSRIGEHLQRLAQIDYAIKTGQTKAQVAMEQFVLALAQAEQTGSSRTADIRTG